MEEKDDKKDFLRSVPQPETEEKVVKTARKPIIATRTCNMEFETAVVELSAGREVHGLTRQERDHLLFWGFAE